MDFESYLYERIKCLILSWNENDIYAISFYVGYNEMNEYKGLKNLPEFSVGYNTERDCGKKAGKYSEDRWNYAMWRQNNVPVIDVYEATEGMDCLIEWFGAIGIDQIGSEDTENEFDEEMNYIGKGPKGYYEFLILISDIAKRLQTDGTVKTHFGSIPIIVHDLDYSWYVFDATLNANPNGEAMDFLKALENGFLE